MSSTDTMNQNTTSTDIFKYMRTSNTPSDPYQPTWTVSYTAEDALKAKWPNIIPNTDTPDPVVPDDSIWDAMYFKSSKEEVDYYKSRNKAVYQALLNSLFSLSEHETKAEYISVYTHNKQEIINLNDTIQSLKDLIKQFDSLVSSFLAMQGNIQSWADAALGSRNLIKDLHDTCEEINRMGAVASTRANRIVADIEQRPSWQHAKKDSMFSYARLSEALRKAHEQVSSGLNDKN